MAFYTADWFRKLVKEDHKFIQEYVSKKDNDIRSYIDSTLPFTLYLEIGSIRKNILQPEAKAIKDLCALIGVTDPNIFIKALESAYKKTINEYIDSYPSITSKELQDTLDTLNSSISMENGAIKSTIQRLFKKTVTIKELSKKDKSVLILSPKFTTIQSNLIDLEIEHINNISVVQSEIIEEIKVQDSYKNELHTYVFDDIKSPKGVIQIVHGLNEHGLRYVEFAEFLNQSGYVVVVFDHLSQGYSRKAEETFVNFGKKGHLKLVDGLNSTFSWLSPPNSIVLSISVILSSDKIDVASSIASYS